MVSKSDKTFMVALAMKLVVLVTTIYHVGCLLQDKDDGYTKFPDFYIVFLINVFLLFGIVVHWLVPVIAWLIGYTLIILVASVKTFVTGRPCWAAGISHSGSTKIIQWIGSGDPYDVAYIFVGLQFVLVYLTFVAMVAQKDAEKENLNSSQITPRGHVEINMGRRPFISFRGQNDGGLSSLAGGSLISSSTETLPSSAILPTDQRRTRGAPPSYTEVQMPPKYEDAVV